MGMHAVVVGGVLPALGSVNIRQAVSSPERQAAALLRAQSFYGNKDRNPFAMQSFLKMKAEHILEAMENRVAGQDEFWREVAVTPFIAIANPSELGPIENDFDAPPMIHDVDGSPVFALGTLDLNIGLILPAEDLKGKFPEVDDKEKVGRQRAYLSNVAVAPAARRKGVAKALIDSASAFAKEHGVLHLYVHVEAENEAAKTLYTAGCSFRIDQEESESYARLRSRNRRLLLWKPLASS